MPDALIPPNLWGLLRVFLATGASGQFVGHVSNGRVLRLDFNDTHDHLTSTNYADTVPSSRRHPPN